MWKRGTQRLSVYKILTKIFIMPKEEFLPLCNLDLELCIFNLKSITDTHLHPTTNLHFNSNRCNELNQYHITAHSWNPLLYFKAELLLNTRDYFMFCYLLYLCTRHSAVFLSGMPYCTAPLGYSQSPLIKTAH